MILWRVKTTWEDYGDTKVNDNFVEAPDGFEALRLVTRDMEMSRLRHVTIEWLCPVDCFITPEDHG